MGILLEFGDNTTASIRTSQSPSSSPRPPPLTSSRGPQQPNESTNVVLYDGTITSPHSSAAKESETHLNRQREVLSFAGLPELANRRDDEDAQPLKDLHLAVVPQGRILLNAPWITRSGHLPTRLHEGPPALVGESQVLGGGQLPTSKTEPEHRRDPRSALLSVMDRWRNSANPSRLERGDTDSPARKAQLRSSEADSMPYVERRYQSTDEWHAPQMQETQGQAAEAQPQPSLTPSQAARAREIFIASKFLNHWADKTARRLEREAIARRHMIRFRCFGGWCQVPGSHSPAMDQLRVSTVFQKLQRAVAEQETHMKMASSAVAQHFRLRSCRRVSELWAYHSTQHAAKYRQNCRTRSRVLVEWASKASNDRSLTQNITAQRQQRQAQNLASIWHKQSADSVGQHSVAREIAHAHLTLPRLRDWWDMAELERRVRAYNEYRLLRKAVLTFERWNLLARAQAFAWRTDFLAASRAFEKWARQGQMSTLRRETSIQHFQDQRKSQCWRHLRAKNGEHTALLELQSRTLLYIAAMRLMAVFDASVKQRKDREKETLKRYLKKKYAQVSSTRKRRKFFEALERWRRSAIDDFRIADTSNNILTIRQLQLQLAALMAWDSSVNVAQRQLGMAHVRYAQTWLFAWQVSTTQHEEMDFNAWRSWTFGQQLQYVKDWSLASLQQSGQAHTAMTLRQRHERDHRRQVLRQWTIALAEPSRQAEEPMHSLSRFGVAKSVNDRWRLSSSQRSFLRPLETNRVSSSGPMDTPTRWTGMPLPMSRSVAHRPMSSVREANEEEGAAVTSPVEDADTIASSSTAQEAPRARPNLPSTTPRGPVPSYLEPDFRFRNPAAKANPGSTAGRPFRAKAATSYEPAYISTALFERQTNVSRPDGRQSMLVEPTQPPDVEFEPRRTEIPMRAVKEGQIEAQSRAQRQVNFGQSYPVQSPESRSDRFSWSKVSPTQRD